MIVLLRNVFERSGCRFALRKRVNF